MSGVRVILRRSEKNTEKITSKVMCKYIVTKMIYVEIFCAIQGATF
jgi:hypothetical protein